MMKQIFITLLTVMVAIASMIANEKVSFYTFDAQGNKTFYDPNGKITNVEQSSIKRPMSQPFRIATFDDPKLLDIEIVYDETHFTVDCIVAGQANNPYGYFLIKNPKKNLGIQEIPPIASGILCLFKEKVDEHVNNWYVVYKDIKNVKNGEKIIFDINDCIHKITYEPLGQDGNPLNFSIRENDELIKPGEFLKAFYSIELSNVHDGVMHTINSFYGKKMINGEIVYDHLGEIWINDCGPDFTMGNYIICDPEEGRNFTIIEMPVFQGNLSREPSEIVLKNNPSLFKTYNQEFTRSPYSYSLYKQLPLGVQIIVNTGNMAFGGIGIEGFFNIEERDVLIKHYICINDESQPESSLMSMLLIDYLAEENTQQNIGFSSMWWKPSANGRIYQPLNDTGVQGLSSTPFDIVYYATEGNVTDYLRMYNQSNPFLSYNDRKKYGKLGNNCPIISLVPVINPEMPSSEFLQFYYGLVGRFGEGNSLPVYYETLIENETIFDDENDSRKDIFSYDNILIDGEIEGFVNAEILTKNGIQGEDWYAPVLTHLLTRSNVNFWTDRFELAEDGFVEFYAGDFYGNMDWSLGQYGIVEYRINSPSTVKVEYAPYASNQYIELDVIPVPEKDFYPGYGSYYSVPLKDVDQVSSNGWFDMRITLTDERGNRHVQTISPVFKIENLEDASVENIKDYDYDSTPVYYNLMGQKVFNPSNGIFIERIGNKSRKVIK